MFIIDYSEPDNLITSFSNIASELRTEIKRLNGKGIRKLLLVAGCWVLVAGTITFGQTDYYSKSTGDLNLVATWGLNPDGSGASPANFTTANRHFNLRNNAAPSIGANWTVSGAGSKVIIGDGTNPCVFTVPNPRIFTATTDISNNGTLKITSTAGTPYSGTLTVNNGGTYEHAIDGGTIPSATWNISSNCNITGVTTNVPDGLSQPFGNVTWNCTGQTGTELNINPLETGNGGSVTGNFSLISTGTGSIRLSNVNPRVLDISGDFNISGGTFHLAIAGGTATVNVGGDFNMTGGTINETGTSTGFIVFNNGGTTQNFRRTAGTISSNISFTVNSNVTIDFGTSDYANGGGTFTLSNGATLQTANTTGVNGSIQTTSRSLSTSANYTFDGTAAQVTGTYLPATVNNFTVNNLTGVTLTNTVTAAGILYMTSGNINTGANTFILSNPVVTALNYTSGIIVGRFERFINTTAVNYFFPVGTAAQIQSVTANFVNLTAGSLLVRYISGDPGNTGLPLTDGDGSQVTNQFTSGYWSALAKNSLASTNYSIDLNATGFVPYTINAGTRVLKRTDAGGSWSLNGTHSNAAGSVIKRTAMSGIHDAGGGTHFGIGKSGPGITTHPANQTVCENATANYSIVATGYSLTYQWYKAPGTLLTNDGHFGGVTTSALSITNVVIADAGNYYCIVTDGNGSTIQSTSATLTVNPSLPVSVTIAASSNPVCAGTSVTFTATPVNGGITPAYQWYKGATPVGTGTDTFTYTPVNGDIISVALTSSETCKSGSPATSNSVNITVSPILPVSVTIAASANPVCAGTSVTFTATPVNGGVTPVYQWYKGATPVGTGTAVYTYTPVNGDVILVVLTSGETCKTGSPAASNPVTMSVNPLPVPALAGPVSTCLGVAGNVYTTEASMSNYLWTVSAGGTITAGGGTVNNTVTVTWTTTGAKTVTVNYTNGNGCTATAPTAYNVTVNALPVATALNNGPACVGNSISLTGGAAGMSTYSWTGPNSFVSLLQNPTIAANATIALAGVYTLTITNSNGCTNTAATTVIINALPAATAINNGPVCTGNSLNLTGGPAGMTIYSWTGPGGFTSLLQNPSVSANTISAMAGVYTLTVTNASGCTNTASSTVVVNVSPAATVNNNGPLCAGSAINLTGGPAGMTTYSWTGPNGYISSSQNPSVSASSTLAMAGVYTLTVTNTNGCTNTANTTVVVNALPVATAGNNGPLCSGSPLSLTGGPAGMVIYSWTGPNGFTSSLQNQSVSASATSANSGVYTLTVTNSNGCKSTSTTTVTVTDKPVALGGSDQLLTFIFETQMAAELSLSETGEWSLISGSGHINDIHSPTTRVTELSIGENIFLWKVRNGNCESSAEIKITVYDLFVPSVITPNGDGKNDYFKISENIGKVELIIFNKWGNEEYTNNNYLNDWDGRNNDGADLPNDTYFYILIFDKSKPKKGSVLINR